MKFSLKVKNGPKLHTPSFTRHGRKYKLGYRRNGNSETIYFYKERGRYHNVPSSRPYPYKRLASLAGPQASAADVAAQGNYNNPLRSRYG